MGSKTSFSVVLAAFVAGVALQLQQALLFYAHAYLFLTAGALVLLFFACWRGFPSAWASGFRYGFPLILTVLLAAALGFGLTGLRAAAFQASALNPALEGQDIQLTVQVQAMPQVGEDGLRFRAKVESALLDGRPVVLPPQIYLGWYSGFGARHVKTPVSLTSDIDTAEFSLELQRQPQNLRAGERWLMAVRLKAPHGNSNPHGFDYELWLWEQGLQATGYVRAGPHDVPPKKIGDSWAQPVERARQTVREAIFERIDSKPLAGVLAALVVGDQNAIERADWDVFRATGVAHLMSISGLHITMFAWAASLLIRWLWRRSAGLTPRFCLWLPASSAGALGGLALAVLYALFAGWGVPAQRTICMLATVVLLRQSGKQWPWPFVWLLTMAVVVAFDPWALMQAGFWLSFVAVAVLFATGSSAEQNATNASDSHIAIYSIAANARRTCATALFDGKNGVSGHFVAPKMLQVALSILRSLRSAAREQWVVTLALTPLSLLLFNQVSVVGLLANAVAIPWVTLLVTPLAMLGVIWAPVWDAAAWAVNLLAIFLQWLASWPMASISVAAAPLWCAVAGVLGGTLLALRLPWSWRVLGVPLLLPVLLWQPLRPAVGQFDILGADIGQGNSLIVRTASHSLVYDSGPRFSRESDAGNRVLVPLLRALGERIDMLMLSHRDLDHVGGAVAVLAMQPQAVLLSSIEEDHEIQAVRKSVPCVQGQRWSWDGVDFEILHPAAADYDALKKPNTMSCVLRISSVLPISQTALLVGDLESQQELRLAADPEIKQKLKADFLLIPHHGSKTSSSPTFLDAVKPVFALAQAGYRNRFGHPAETVLQRYRERGIKLIGSASCGAASWRSEQPTEVVCQRQQGLRYWHHVLVGLTGLSPEQPQTATEKQ